MVEFIYCSEAVARGLGLTHEGTIFGIPAWIGDVDNGDSVTCVAKVPAMILAIRAMDLAFDFFSWLTGQVVEIPLTIGRSIE